MDVTYESNLNYQGLRFNLTEAMKKLSEYTKKHTFEVHKYTKEESPITNKYEHILFHNRGITGHLLATTRHAPLVGPLSKQMIKNPNQNIDFIDIRLYSHITPTLELEERLNSLVQKYRIER